MKINLKFEQLKDLSFPDFNVINAQLNLIEKLLKIEVEGAWLETNNRGKELGVCTLLFYSWNNFTLKTFDSINNEWNIITLNNFEPLKDICEFECVQEKVFIKGFGAKSKLWIEYELDAPKFDLEFKE